jgi:hypothetical protein
MRYQQLNQNWNADPNAPEPSLTVTEQTLQLEFYLNVFQFEQFQEGDKAYLTFQNCHRYSFNTMNDEGYYRGQYRYNCHQLPWGEFYELFTDWQTDFPDDAVVLKQAADPDRLHHFLFFLKDNAFECVAESWHLQLIR